MQVMLFTAIYDENIISKFINISTYKKIEIKEKNTKILQYYIFSPYKYRQNYLYEILIDLPKCIIFVSKVFHTFLLANFLSDLNFNIRFINGKIPQKEKKIKLLKILRKITLIYWFVQIF